MNAQIKLSNFKDSCREHGVVLSKDDFNKVFLEMKKLQDLYGTHSDPFFYIALNMDCELVPFVKLPWYMLKQLHNNFKPYTTIYLSELETFIENY